MPLLTVSSKIDVLVFYSAQIVENLGISEEKLMDNIEVAFFTSNEATASAGIPLQFDVVRMQKVSVKTGCPGRTAGTGVRQSNDRRLLS